MRTFNLPDLGEGLADAEIVSWHVSEGSSVVADQPLVSVETQKAVVEVPAPWSGVIAKLHVAPGEVVEIGCPLVDFDLEGKVEETGTVVGVVPKAKEGIHNGGAANREKAAPAIRKLARDLGVDLSTVTGSGPGGTIIRADIEGKRTSAESIEPLHGVRRAMARNMAKAHAEVATTNVTEEANISHWPSEEDVTSRLVRAIVAACKAEPALNAWYDGKREARVIHSHIDLGIATNTAEGLFVPVLRDAGNCDPQSLRAALEYLKEAITNRTVPSEELRGQTITLSNFGMIGGRYATLIVMPPQVAILGAGRISQEARVVDGDIIVGRIIPLSLTFDHRAVTGAEATRFLTCVVKDLEN